MLVSTPTQLTPKDPLKQWERPSDQSHTQPGGLLSCYPYGKAWQMATLGTAQGRIPRPAPKASPPPRTLLADVLTKLRAWADILLSQSHLEAVLRGVNHHLLHLGFSAGGRVSNGSRPGGANRRYWISWMPAQPGSHHSGACTWVMRASPWPLLAGSAFRCWPNGSLVEGLATRLPEERPRGTMGSNRIGPEKVTDQ